MAPLSLPLSSLALTLTFILSNHGYEASAFSMGSWSKVGIFAGGASLAPKMWNDLNQASHRSAHKSVNRDSGSQMTMVIDRLSRECVAAVMTSHEVGNEIGLATLQNEILTVGIIGKPEWAGRTLEKYGIKYSAAKTSAIDVLRKSPVSLREGGNPDKVPLPFSDEAKNILTEASKVADYFNSTSVRSEHVLLALMGYNYGEPIANCASLKVLLGINGIEKFSVYKFCENLVTDLKSQPSDDMEIGESTTIVEEVFIADPGSTATLDDVGVDLTRMAFEGRLDVVYGRDNEIRMAMRTLGRRRKNNPCLIGDPGVGKTAIAEAIAQVLASSFPDTEYEKKPKFQIRNPFKNEGDEDDSSATENSNPLEALQGEEYRLPECPKSLAGYRLISIELASLVAGTRNRGDFEEKVQKLIREASNSNIILFIDEIHNLVGTGGGGDGAMNAANLMKPALARGELRVLGSTTTAEYRRYIEKDGALERRFQPLEIKEPTVDETLEILQALMPRYEEFHGVKYTSNSLLAAAKLSNRYISDRFLPDKAIDLLDEAGSMVKMNNDEENYFVTEDAITEVISEISGIPIGRLDTGEKARLRNLELEMGKRIKGQERAVKAVAKSVRRARSGMRDGKRPVASFLFCGPTGVGKTEVCKALAETYFGQEKDMIRIDMSEYMDRFSTSRLVGAPPGYVGYDEGGQLTEAVRRAPHSVVLFDEVEKAHEDVLNVLLQIMDEGKLTDGKGRTVNFKNTVLVMTSNVGSQRIQEVAKKSSGDNLEQSLEMADVVKEELEQTMKPELLNRIDEIIVFSPLSYDNLRDIASNILSDTAKRAAADQNIRINVGEDVVKLVTREGFQMASQFGARPIRRAAQRFLEDTMAEAIMREFVNEGDEVWVGIAEDNEDQCVVKITRVSLNGDGQKDSILIPVEDHAGIGSVQSDLEKIVNGPLPPLGDATPPSPEPENFQ